MNLLDGQLQENLLALDAAYGKDRILVKLQENQFQLSVDTFGRDEEIFTRLIETAITFFDRLTNM